MTIELTEQEQSLLYNIVVTERNNIETQCYIEGDYYPKELLDRLDIIIDKVKPIYIK